MVLFKGLTTHVVGFGVTPTMVVHPADGGVEVTVYPVIAEPPVSAGAIHASDQAHRLSQSIQVGTVAHAAQDHEWRPLGRGHPQEQHRRGLRLAVIPGPAECRNPESIFQQPDILGSGFRTTALRAASGMTPERAVHSNSRNSSTSWNASRRAPSSCRRSGAPACLCPRAPSGAFPTPPHRSCGTWRSPRPTA